MKARLAFMSALFFLFGLANQAQAKDRHRKSGPGEYELLTFEAAQNQLNQLQQSRRTPKDLNAIYSEVHNVSIIDIPTSQTDSPSIRAYPRGENFKLNAVYSGN